MALTNWPFSVIKWLQEGKRCGGFSFISPRLVKVYLPVMYFLIIEEDSIFSWLTSLVSGIVLCCSLQLKDIAFF